jgi:hypothetical protein
MLLLNGERVERAVWDVVKKPGIKPRKLTKVEVGRIVLDGTYFGEAVPTLFRTVCAGSPVPDWREDATLYQFRLSAETIANPDKYYARRVIPRTDQDLLEYAQELWDVGQDMALCRRLQRNYRNSGSCMAYGRPCQFLGICSGYDQPDSHNWQRKANVHNELPEIADGRDVLTNSRVRCFQSCRRKHHYQYELGIERVGAEEAEALYFGNVWHAAMDAWWTACENERETNGDNEA